MKKNRISKLTEKILLVRMYLTLVHNRVTSLEQLSLAEFSGEYARPKINENEHKKVPGIWFNSVMKVKICKNQNF